jgi:hypothetical protein
VDNKIIYNAGGVEEGELVVIDFFNHLPGLEDYLLPAPDVTGAKAPTGVGG